MIHCVDSLCSSCCTILLLLGVLCSVHVLRSVLFCESFENDVDLLGFGSNVSCEEEEEEEEEEE